MSVPDYKIRTAIKAYLDSGGDPEFYIVSKKTVLEAQRNSIDRLLLKIHHDETTDHTGFNISKRRVSELASQVIKEDEQRYSPLNEKGFVKPPRFI